MYFAYSDYYDFYEYMDPFAEGMGAAAVILGIWLISMLLMLAYSVLVYVLHSVGTYSIAKRRGIHHAWLSWLPLGNVWVLGSISDQYQYVAKGKICSRRKVLLGLNIATYVLMIPFYAIYFLFMADFLVYADQLTMSDAIAPALAILAIALVMAVIAVVATVFQYIAYYDLFNSCNPNNSVAFLVLSILFSFLLPFFVFACRKKDLGMPPRRFSVPTPPWQPTTPPVWQPPAAPPVLEVQPIETEPEEPAEQPEE